MERRLILAIVLSFALLGAYWLFFLRKPAPVQTAGPAVQHTQPQAKPQTLPPAGPQAKEEVKPAAQESEPPALTTQAISSKLAQDVVVETPLYLAKWNTKGAVLTSWKLQGKNKEKAYKDEKGEPLELVNTDSLEQVGALKEANRYPFYIDSGDQAINEKINNNKSEYYRASSTSLHIKEGRQEVLTFTYDDGAGINVEKKFTFNGSGYDFGLSIRLRVKGEDKAFRLLWGPGIGPVSQVAQRQRVGSNRGFMAFASGKDYRMDERKYKPEQNAFNYVSWAAYEETYFTALFMVPGSQGTAVFGRDMVENRPYFYLSVAGAQSAYLGPKELDRLRALDPVSRSTKKLVQFGFFGSIVEILLVVISAIYKVLPNWGIAIIVLTIIIKILFFPLTYSSTKSMARMQELQPKIKALRAKYKKSKTDIAQRRQMNEEMMKLYKEHGVNPAGGCLPLLIQLPVFWAIWRLLSVSIELRHSPFVFWIKDLSVKDPYLVTPILMGITQFISQKMTPSGADPSQQKIMLIMPVIMTFFFLGFPSGLVLYWLASNVLQILQQHIMNRMQAKRKANEDRRKK